MKKMIALKRHPYGVGVREAGERYEATAGEARTLVALRWAKYDDESTAAPVAPTSPARADGEAQADTTPTSQPARQYQRRDMQAQDSAPRAARSPSKKAATVRKAKSKGAAKD